MHLVPSDFILHATYPIYTHDIFSVGDPDSCEISLDPLHNVVSEENDQVNEHQQEHSNS